MPTSFVSKTPISIPLPDGSYCALFNDYTNGYTSYYYLDAERTSLYTKLDMSSFSQQRCLQYHIYSDKYATNPDSVWAVPFLNEDSTINQEDGSVISQPLFECISPMATYTDLKGAANILFWTNLKPSQSFILDNESGQYVYDQDKILRIKHEDINNFSFETGQITRVLCSVTIHFEQLYIRGEVSDGLTVAPKKLVPIATDVVVIKQVKSDSPVLDFSTGGSGGTTMASNSRHAHTNNSDCGFAFAVFHPGTGVPLGNPWKN